MIDVDVLLPVRHPQGELFICDVADAVLKDDMASMEHPFFALTTQKDMRIRRYENNGQWLEVRPGANGLATIFDKDILVFATSQLMAAKKAGRPLLQEIVMSPRDLLVFTNRGTGGREYRLLKEALGRLGGTRFASNIATGGVREQDEFGMVEWSKVVEDEATGRVLEVRIKFSDFLFRAIQSQEVLTLAPEYFRLRRAIDRRVYEIARKHCGAQAEWSISLDLLKKKTGSDDTLKKFRMKVRELEARGHLPDYTVKLQDTDKVTFSNRRVKERVADKTGRIVLSGDAYHDARQVAPGWDVHVLEQKWRSWLLDRMDEGLEGPRDADAAFCGFCRKWAERNGTPDGVLL